MTDLGAYHGRTVFLTGASGIVGSWLVRSLLSEGAAVVALVRDEDPRCEFVRSGGLGKIFEVRAVVSG